LNRFARFGAMASLIALSACGVETASTAATGAALKKQELDQGRQALERAEQKIDAASARMHERAEAGSRQER
jgi:hypothetical protein